MPGILHWHHGIELGLNVAAKNLIVAQKSAPKSSFLGTEAHHGVTVKTP